MIVMRRTLTAAPGQLYITIRSTDTTVQLGQQPKVIAQVTICLTLLSRKDFSAWHSPKLCMQFYHFNRMHLLPHKPHGAWSLTRNSIPPQFLNLQMLFRLGDCRYYASLASTVFEVSEGPETTRWLPPPIWQNDHSVCQKRLNAFLRRKHCESAMTESWTKSVMQFGNVGGTEVTNPYFECHIVDGTTGEPFNNMTYFALCVCCMSLPTIRNFTIDEQAIDCTAFTACLTAVLIIWVPNRYFPDEQLHSIECLHHACKVCIACISNSRNNLQICDQVESTQSNVPDGYQTWHEVRLTHVFFRCSEPPVRDRILPEADSRREPECWAHLLHWWTWNHPQAVLRLRIHPGQWCQNLHPCWFQCHCCDCCASARVDWQMLQCCHCLSLLT